jgi:hypothetical protein
MKTLLFITLMIGLSPSAKAEVSPSRGTLISKILNQFRHSSLNSPKDTFLFPEARLQEIIRVTEVIEQQTHPEDLLIMLGRAPLWFAEAMVLKGSQKNIKKVAFSNAPYATEESIPTWEQLKAYRKYLEFLSINTESLINHPGKIVIIDHVQTGSTVLGFIKILCDWVFEKEHINIQDKFRIINLTRTDLFELSQELYLKDIKYSIFNINMESFANCALSNCRDEDSLGIYFPISHWTRHQKICQGYHSNALKIREQLKAYIKNLKP